MSPRLAVADVSTAIDGSAPCPPGSTMSGPNDGLPPDDAAAPAPGTVITAANAMSASTRPSRRSDRSTRMIPPRSASAAPPPRDRWQAVVTGRGDFENRLRPGVVASHPMDPDRARTLLAGERERIERALARLG